MTKEININQAESGMITAENIVSKTNQVLIPAGTALTSEQIKLAKAQGIIKINIQEGTIKPNTEEITRMINHMFEHVKDDPNMAMLFNAVKNLEENGELLV